MEPKRNFMTPLPLLLLLSFVLFLLFLLPSTTAFFSDGTDKAFVKYPRWQACLNGSINFEFRSTDPSGLLLYTDDGGKYDFFELRLVKGKMQLRFNLNSTMGLIIADEYKRLDDNRWHKVGIQRNKLKTVLLIDNWNKSTLSYGLDFQFGSLEKNNYVFLGGMPEFYADPERLQYLALPSVMFEERWRGQIRNLQYSNCSCPLRTAEILDMQDASLDNPCETNNPCNKKDPNCDCLIDPTGSQFCDCSDKSCGPEYVINYIIPFDKIENNLVQNPTQLKAAVSGRGKLRKGVIRRAMDFDGVNDRVTVEAARCVVAVVAHDRRE
jgi:hypothetical protein